MLLASAPDLFFDERVACMKLFASVGSWCPLLLAYRDTWNGMELYGHQGKTWNPAPLEKFRACGIWD
ncbi:hypothetical protein [Natronohydrobacter thiooxidans]|jgi:hypothetical protein|uniref:hypothetical protein n=1 Tax=Natronohydrobacter thiooxidans TaxID=87172 RepID=UPI000AE7A32E|nr:hypothetical protein [Natronohydrobacter thiooxidans]